MKVKPINDEQLLQEAFDVLMTHLGPSKALKFWSNCQLGGGDYLKFKDQLFAGETVDSLYEKIKDYQDSDFGGY